MNITHWDAFYWNISVGWTPGSSMTCRRTTWHLGLQSSGQKHKKKTEKTMKNPGNLMKSDEIWWNLMKSDEIWWNLMKSDEIWWNLMKSDEIWWNLMKSDEIWWNLMKSDEIWWNLMKSDEIWWNLMKSDEIWWNLGVFLDPPRFSNPSASPRFIPSTRNTWTVKHTPILSHLMKH